MNINRHNYEEYFLLYADNELSAAEKEAVDVFVAEHPDLKEEFDMLLQAILPAGDLVFNDKESLYRTTDASLVNMTNFESFFVRYHDDELTNEEKAATELFVYNHPEFQADFELIQQARLQSDVTLVFPDKRLLFRQENTERRPVIRLWLPVAAAAILLLLAGLFWLRTDKQVAQPENAGIVKTAPASQPQANELPQAIDSPQAPHTNDKEDRVLVANEQPVQHKGSKATTTPVQQPEMQKAAPQPLVAQPLLAVSETPQQPDLTVTVPVTSPAPDVKPSSTPGGSKPAEPEYVYVDTNKSPSGEDYIYVPGSEENKKTPLRGLFRKASRVIEQNNPLGAEKKRSGVFTASAEQ
ncbi:MAG: hypothetical protein QM664_07355 [Flavihumibacter sp.]